MVPIDIEPGKEFSEVIAVALPKGGFATAQIVHPEIDDNGIMRPGRDGLALDDVAYAAIPASKLYSVLLVSRNDAEAEPVKVALGELGKLEDLVDPSSSYAVTFEDYEDIEPERRDGFDLAVFVSGAPKALPESGNFLCLFGLPKGLPATARGIEQWPRIRDLDREHPLNRFLEPKSMAPAKAMPLDLTGGEIFMQTGSGPVGVVFKTAKRKVVYLGLDVLSDLFFLQFAFPILVRNALGWMHEQESLLLEATYRPGEVIRPRFAVSDANVRVGYRRGDGTEESVDVPVRDGKFVFRDTDVPGHYWVYTLNAVFLTSVNLFASRESDLRMPESEDTSSVDVERSGFLFGRDLWPLLLLVALGLWCLEWGLFHRRLTE